MDKARTLYEALGSNLDSSLTPLVNDYRINLFEIAWLTDGEAARFKSDFGIVADYFIQMRKTGTYTGTPARVRHMREVLQLLSVLTDDSRFLETVDGAGKGDEPGNMCEVLDKIEKRGIEQGIERGDIIRAKKAAFRMNQKGLPLEDIADILESDTETVSAWIRDMSCDEENTSGTRKI